MTDQEGTANDAISEVRYVLQKTLKSFDTDWEMYKEDFKDCGAEHLGRRGKHSVEDIVGEHESITFGIALKDTLEDFIGGHALRRFNFSHDPERFLSLVKNFFSYLEKTADWFHDIFSDLDNVAWPFHSILSYSEGCRNSLYESFYSGIRMKLRNQYVEQCKDLRCRYPYDCMDVYMCFYKKTVVPIFSVVRELEKESDVQFWWQPFYDELESIFREKVTNKECDERSFVILAKCSMQAEMHFIKYLPDTAEKENLSCMTERLNDVICKLYWERKDCSLIGLLLKNSFDKFLFGQLLMLLMCSAKQKNIFLMHLRSKIRTHFELMVLQSVQFVPAQPFKLEELKPLLSELHETKKYLWERLEETADKFPCLAFLKSEIFEGCRKQLELYEVDDMLLQTDGTLINRLQDLTRPDSGFHEEARFIALYIKHFAWRDEFMGELETFAEQSINRKDLDVHSTLTEFVSRHRSVCSNALCKILEDANLIDE